MKIRSLGNFFSLGFVFCLALSGCGGADHPPLGSVSGTVTMDGDPLVGVMVLFKPEVGRAAVGTTDEDGHYTTEYTYRVPGAKTGPTTVMMEWPLGAKDTKPLAERYTTKSELKVEVKPGSNTFDFDLKSDAKAPPKRPEAD